MIRVTTLSKIVEKYDRACTKHDRTGYTLDDMGNVLCEEMTEMAEAEERGQIHGAHGMIDEAYDTIAVLLRMIETLETMPDAKPQ